MLAPCMKMHDVGLLSDPNKQDMIIKSSVF